MKKNIKRRCNIVKSKNKMKEQANLVARKLVKTSFIPIQEKRLLYLFSTIVEEYFNDGDFELLKFRPIIKRYDKSQYKSFGDLDTFNDKLLYLKEEESNFLNLIDDINSLYHMDCEKNISSDKGFKKRETLFNRLVRSHRTHINKFGKTYADLTKFVKRFPSLIFNEYLQNFRNFIWIEKFFETMKDQIEESFNNQFDLLSGKFDEKIEELSILLDLDLAQLDLA